MNELFNDLSKVSADVFLIYIGFNIASFAFLFQYLTFPKNLLSEFYKKISTDDKKKLNRDRLNNLISYFFEIDALTFLWLAFAVCSILIVLFLFALKISSMNPQIARLFIIIISIFYCVSINIIVGCAICVKRGSPWWSKGGRGFTLGFESFFTISYTVSNLVILINKSVCWLFINQIIFLMILFVSFLVTLLKRGPLTRLVDEWFSGY